MSKRFTKKGQMEIFGLLIIITLIILGVIFALRFVVMKEPTNIQKSFVQEGIAQNMLDSILDTKPNDCYVSTFSDLLVDCADFYPLGAIYCDNLNSCEYSQREIDKILNNSLRNWSYDYEFILERGSTELLRVQNNNCTMERDAALQPFPGSIEIKFYVCS